MYLLILFLCLISSTCGFFSSVSPLSHSTHRQQTKFFSVTPPHPHLNTKYDAKAIKSYYDARLLPVAYRLNVLGLPLLTWFASLVIDKHVWKRDSLPHIQVQRGVQLRNILINSESIAVIKSGQAISLRPDLLKVKAWADELGKLVDDVAPFSDGDAMKIIEDASLSLDHFEFLNTGKCVASASIGQVYKARVIHSPLLVETIGKEEAARWGDTIVAIKVQRNNAPASVALDMYLIRRAAEWAEKFRGGELPSVADELGKQLFGELDYVSEAHNCENFGRMYRGFASGRVVVPHACLGLTKKSVLVMEWVDGSKGPWSKDVAIDIVRLGIKCSVSQLLDSGLFHADPHRGNLLKTKDDNLAYIDFGNMASFSSEERYGLIGLVLGLQNKDLPLITENLRKLNFIANDSQLEELIPKLKRAFKNATGGTGKASALNFAALQAELDVISRENALNFKIPGFFATIIRTLTILEGLALSVDPDFRLVKGAYPFVLALLLTREGGSSSLGEKCPEELKKVLVNLLTVDEGRRINWERLSKFLNLAASSNSKQRQLPSNSKTFNIDNVNYNTYELFAKFLTSDAGLFLKLPLVTEIASTIDIVVSKGELNLRGLNLGLRVPGGVKFLGQAENARFVVLERLVGVLITSYGSSGRETDLPLGSQKILQYFQSVLQSKSKQKELSYVLDAALDVAKLVAVEIVEIRAKRAIADMFT